MAMTSGSGDGDQESGKKRHRAKQSGPKLAKKKANTPKDSQNAKAFAVQHTTKAARHVQRTLDYHTRGQHLPKTTGRVVDTPPPIVVALVGPPGSGKSTLLKALVKHFAHQAISVVKGPLTVVVGKKVRLTFIECGCDVNSMLDAAKVADVILLMVNVRCGLEMYHFEFINMVQIHGMPRIIPVLNHLDSFNDSSSSRAVRRKIKQRLWVDLNSKIFLLSRFVPKKYASASEQPLNEYSKPGEYLLPEVRRLARLIVVKVPHSTDWRTSNPFLLIDRLEDITPNELLSDLPTCDRTISMYGWVRGAPLPPALSSPAIHIAGLGDVVIAECTRQPDPCPLPCQVAEAAATASASGKPSRHLAERDRKIYAPMSSIGGVLFDRDATYINLGGSHYLSNRTIRNKTDSLQQPNQLTQSVLDEVYSTLQEAGGIDTQLDRDHCIRILGDTPYLSAEQVADDVAADEEMHSDTTGSESEADDDDESDSDDDNQVKESPEDVNVFSNQTVAGFLVPAGQQLDPSSVEKTAKQSVSKKNVHLEVKEILDDIQWNSTKATRTNWNLAIYGTDSKTPQHSTHHTNKSDSSSTVAEMFRPVQLEQHGLSAMDEELDFTCPRNTQSEANDWTAAGRLERITNCFTTGKWDATEDAETLLNADASARAKLAADEAKKVASATASRTRYREDKIENGEDENSDDDEEEEEEEEELGDDDDDDASLNADIFRDSDAESNSAGEDAVDPDEEEDPNAEFEKRLLRPTKRQKLLEKRKRHKELFGQLYEAAAGGQEATAFYDKLIAARDAQLAANQAVLQSLPKDAVDMLEGFSPGAYVRLEIKGIPHQFVDRFNPCQPLVAGGLPSAEETKGYLQVRFRTHRWLRRVLRSTDPITVSIGWRRYQTVGIYSKEEHNLRNRFLKYSLPHEHCFLTIYGPLVPAKTGVVAFVNSTWRPLSDPGGLPKFRIAGTGSVTTTNQSFQVMKKLKLVGEPYKIFSKTAFIRGMFNTPLEVSKMVGAKIQTVSNVRGLIKAALTNPSASKPGDFRATFEAQIGRSDLVYLRTFIAIDLPNYYNPVLNRLCSIEGEAGGGGGGGGADGESDGAGWRLLRTMRELRQEAGQEPDKLKDSQYKPIHRPVYVPTPLYVPTRLVESLPFAQKPKPSKREARNMFGGGDPVRGALLNSVIPASVESTLGGERDTREQMLHRMRLLHADFKQRQHVKMATRVGKHKELKAKIADSRNALERKRRKSYFARKGASKSGKGGRNEQD